MRTQMARSMGAGLLISAMLASSPGPAAAVNCGGGQTVFSNAANLGGPFLVKAWGQNLLSMPAGWNDVISSFESNGMPDGCGVKIFKNVNWDPAGGSIRYCGNLTRNTMPAGWNDVISSVKFVSDCPI